MADYGKEYDALRQEILNGKDAIKNYESILYASTMAVFAFAFTQSEPLIFLLPMIAVIPVYIMSMNQISSMLRIGAYIKVFLEGDEFFWETRLLKYDEKYVSKNPNIDPYVFISITSFLLCVLKMNFADYLSIEFWIRISIAILCIITCLVLIKRKRIDYRTVKLDYITKWEKVKDGMS